MKTTKSVFFLLLACALGCAPTVTTESEPDDSDDGEPVAEAASATGTCPDPLLSFAPGGTDNEAVWSASGNWLAGRLDPVSTSVECATVIVSLFTGEFACTLPNTLQIGVWGEWTATPTITPWLTTVVLEDGIPLPSATANERRMAFHVTSKFRPGAYPYVAMVTSPTTCAGAGFPQCDSSKAWLLSGGTWGTLVAKTGIEDQLHFGLADCVAVP